MEIRILSAGKAIGPYSEAQVRQYLSEGLISATDPAHTDGMSEWIPTEQLLARISNPEAVPVGASAGNGDVSTQINFEPPRSITVRATGTLPRVKRGPIAIQPLFVGETESVRRSRTKTLIKIEEPRPTTQLPPVPKFVPREERKLPKGLVDTGQLAPGHFFDREESEPDIYSPPTYTEPQTYTPPSYVPPSLAPTAPPVPEEEMSAEAEPVATVEPDTEPSALPAEDENERGVPHTLYAMWYASLIVGLVALAVLLAVVYAVWYFDRPAPHSTDSAAASAATNSSSDTSPQTAADFSARGFAKQQKGDLDGALADYNQAIKLDPHNVEALNRRALTERDKGNWDAALADFNSVLAIAPDNADAYSNRGYIKQTKGDLDGALADYTEALSLKPTSAQSFYNVGLIKVRRGDIDGGMEAFSKAIDLNPKLARAYFSRGNAKNSEGDTDGAIGDYTQSLEIDPTNAMASFNRGAARQTRGDTTGALADYSQAIANDSNLAPAYRGRADIEVQRGEFDAALADATKSAQLDPKDTGAVYTQAQAELGLHTLDAAEADFTQYCTAAPHGTDCDNARLYLWVIAAEQGLRQKADDGLSAALLNSWNSTPEDLTSKIAAFLVGHIREDELITQATTPDPSLQPGRFCRVWYFAGVKRQISGDAPMASIYFQKAIATNQQDCPEYLLSRAQIVSLGQTRQASSQPTPAQ
jgi:tetratricopeptide (TPR) repeat protein